MEYTDLPHGDYVFQVKAVDRDLAYSARPAEVRVGGDFFQYYYKRSVSIPS